MKAWATDRYGAIDNVTLRDLPTPTVGPGQVLIKVQGAALNPADIKVATGKDGGKFLHARKFPLILGFDFCGVVEQSNDDTWAVGDAVFGHLPYTGKNTQGSFAEYLVAAGDEIGRKPKSVEAPVAASLATVGLTALQGLHKGGVGAGKSVLVNGASGGVGSLAVQIAKQAGATVWGTCSEKNMDAVRDLGADEVVDYRKTALNALDHKFDIVFDTAATSSYGACLPILNAGAAFLTTLPSLGFVTGKIRSLFSSRSVTFVVVKSRQADLDKLAALVDGGDVKPLIDTTYTFEQVPDGLAHMARGVRGKLVVGVT